MSLVIGAVAFCNFPNPMMMVCSGVAEEDSHWQPWKEGEALVPAGEWYLLLIWEYVREHGAQP